MIKEKKVPVNGSAILLLAILTGIILETGYTGDDRWYWGLLITVPLLFIAVIAPLHLKCSNTHEKK
jgi:hypothetical protein